MFGNTEVNLKRAFEEALPDCSHEAGVTSIGRTARYQQE